MKKVYFTTSGSRRDPFPSPAPAALSITGAEIPRCQTGSLALGSAVRASEPLGLGADALQTFPEAGSEGR